MRDFRNRSKIITMEKNQNNNIFEKSYQSVNMYYGWHTHQVFHDAIKHLGKSEGMALDIGCGEGRYSIALAEYGFSTLAIDKSRTGVEKICRNANQRNLNISCKVRDLKDFEFPRSEYDIVVASTILDHLSDDVRIYVISGIKEALKIGGILYASVFTEQDPGYRGNEASLVSECAKGIKHYFAVGELKDVFSEFNILFFRESYEYDTSHGSPHYHGIARMIAQKVV